MHIGPISSHHCPCCLLERCGCSARAIFGVGNFVFAFGNATIGPCSASREGLQEEDARRSSVSLCPWGSALFTPVLGRAHG